jgi:BASS family bile acid:Na+ symporter
VVPVFARMAQADLALAAGLTALFPLLSVFLIPLICRMALKAIAFPGAVQFDVSEALILMLATIVLPLGFGIAVNHVALVFARKRVRQVEIFSEMAGAASLAFATATEWPAILSIGWRPLAAMAVVGEISLLLGYSLGGPDPGSRQVIGLGTSNRNIALDFSPGISLWTVIPFTKACRLTRLESMLITKARETDRRSGSKCV